MIRGRIRASTRGITISALIALPKVYFLTLNTMASLKAATSLIVVYSLLNFGAVRLVSDGGKRRALIVFSFVACLLAVLIWIIYALRTAPGLFGIFLSFLIGVLVSESLLQRYHGKRIVAQKGWGAQPSKR